MKIKHIAIGSALATALLFGSLISCSDISNQTDSGQTDTAEVSVEDTKTYGNASFRVFVPDYAAMANASARIIMPGTAKVRFSYYNSKTSAWVVHSTVDLEADNSESISGSNGLIGKVYSLTFENIPTYSYAVGKLKLEMLDSSENVLSSATNDSVVNISMGEVTSPVFYSLPASTANDSGTLAAGELKVLRKAFDEKFDCVLTVSIPSGSSNPVLVVFDENGKFEKTLELSAEGTVDCAEYKGLTKYFGFYSETATSYTASLAYTIPESALTDLTTAFDNILTSSDWTVTNSSAITESDGVYIFDGMKTTGGFARTVVLNETKALSFKVKTNLYEAYDGSLQFLIDGEVVASYTGLGGDWQNALFEIEAGEHTIAWKRSDSSSSYTSGETLFVSVKDFAFGDAIQGLSTINQTFADTLDENMWIGAGVAAEVLDADPVYATWVQYGDALVDTHEEVFKIGTRSSSTSGTSSLTIYKITVSEESALSFDYKCDLYDADYLRVYVDEESTPSFETTGSGQMWQNASVILSAGSHSVKFAAEKTNNYYSTTYTNAVYLDNITLAANTTASVDISPKGVQETYVGGFDIPFTAKALRSDGSVINEKTVTWDGATDGTFSPSTEGTFTVTATIDGKTASNTTVTVHSADYLSDSVTLGGNEFTGTITNLSGSRTNTTNITWEDPTPNGSSFSADGFFILKGTANGVNGYVKITKDDYVTYYFLPEGDFYQRVWLRFGAGTYTVFVTEANFTYYSPDGDYQGDIDISGYGSFYTSGATTYTMTVTNTNDSLSAEEASYLLPSSWCQCDDFRITNAVHDVIANLPEDATDGQKLEALHNWEVRRMYYDYDSFNNTSKRKAQDALHVLEYEMGVCEGYANLFTALERVIGIKGTVVCAQYNAHAWNNTNYGNSWLLLDATWDDPLASGDSETDKKPLREDYTYFLLTTSEDSATRQSHGSYAIMPSLTATIVGGDGVNNMRSVVSSDGKKAPYVRGLPNGWY